MHLSASIVVVLSIISSKVLAQDYTVTPLSIRKCRVLAGEEIDYTVSLDQEKDGSKSLSFKANLAKVLDKECMYRTYVDIMSGGIKYVRYMQGDGNMCDALTRLVEPAYVRFRSLVKPPITEKCTIKPGTYSIDRFTLKKEELNMPIPSKGQFKAEAHLFCNKVQVACIIGELLITEDDD